MKEMLEKLQSEVANLTRTMAEKAASNHDAEVKELSAKLTDVQKELADRKNQFELGKVVTADQKQVDSRMDELFIASALLRTKSGALDPVMDTLIQKAEYRDSLKASGITVDANTSVLVGGGAEIIPTSFSSTMLSEIFLELEIANLFQRINMPSATFVFPFAPKRVIARTAVEAVAPTKDKANTGNITFNAKKLMANVEFTDELEMDSITAVLPFIRKQLIDGFALAQETACLNGDLGTTIYTAAAGASSEDARRLLNGIREDSKNVAKANNLLQGVTDVAAALRTMRASMKKYGKKPSDLAIIVDMSTYNKLITNTAFQSLYSYGAGATLLTGELGRFDNIPIIVTELLPQTGVTVESGPDSLGQVNTAGVYDATTSANNTSKICVMVNKNAYMWGDRKQFALETFRNPFTQSLNLIGAQRLDFKKVLTAADPTVAVGVGLAANF